jgi:hypothetical protein
MFEEASRLTVGRERRNRNEEGFSRKHMTLVGAAEASLDPAFKFKADNYFMYVNYAEGGACGDTPFRKHSHWALLKTKSTRSKRIVRGSPATSEKTGSGDILFIIWFGAQPLHCRTPR